MKQIFVYSFLLISNKSRDLSLLHWVGVGGQCSKKNLLHCSPTLFPKAELWVLEAHVHLNTYGPLIDTALYPYVILLMRATFLTPNGTCLTARCHFTGPKKSRFPGPNRLPLALVMELTASKALCMELYKSQAHK
jgi:hypothetical protein